MATLMQMARQRTREAARCGALASIETELHVLRCPRDSTFESALEDYVVLMHLAKRPYRPDPGAARANPFLPYEPELFVANMGEEHVLLLNKFNVFADHLLLVTRDFVEQETLLNEADFSAIARLMAEEDGLAFFNSGPIAGASQRHKHLQFVPLPLGPRDVPALPMLSLLRQGQLGFRYAFESLTLDWAAPSIGQALLERYRAQLSSLKLTTREASQGPEPEPPSPAFDSAQRPLPYNLLLGRDWMAVVPRCRESAGGLSLNALAYVGSFFTNQPLSLEQMRQRGALQLLGECGCASS